eukprot:gb/GECG01012118.1/.p1 GENE.gb/GECG01012118.1/~~gb/GECG01012118.1/.p1  ORF type:complete len:673 (+),score=84.93 gb/GECG01012118.1/:1-2019(+)
MAAAGESQPSHTKSGVLSWILSKMPMEDVRHDLSLGVNVASLQLRVYHQVQHQILLPDMLECAADKWPEKIALIGLNDEPSRSDASQEYSIKELLWPNTWTYRQWDQYANQVAHFAMSKLQLQAGDNVALFMSNDVQFLGIWHGLNKAGVSVALVNSGLTGKSLIHSVRIADARAILYSDKLESVVADVEESLRDAMRPSSPVDHRPCGTFVRVLTRHSVLEDTGPQIQGASILQKEMKNMPWQRPNPRVRETIGANDSSAFIYTSGTTGLPKAALVPHVKFLLGGVGFYRIYNFRSSDKMYQVLPLFHSAAGIIGHGLCVLCGIPMVIREKFSIRNWWSDIVIHQCTVAQYIGELCRYLVSAPPHPLGLDQPPHHKLRMVFGNGLRPDVWARFQSRFGIPQVGEFYGATEANTMLFNHCTTTRAQGAVGTLGRLIRSLKIIEIIKFDDDEEMPVRDKNGWCIPCQTGEPGELVSKIGDDSRNRFHGYKGNEEATKKKILWNVFRKGDAYFRSGDLVRVDDSGYVYFVDRIGDTFRWKGENVATTEVASAMGEYPAIEEANVYGVPVPHADGKAGMAAIVLSDGYRLEDLDTSDLFSFLRERLPAYAIPVFLRILPKQPITGTFKQQKTQLRKEGADPTTVKDDPLFVLEGRQYTRLDEKKWKKISAGEAKL